MLTKHKPKKSFFNVNILRTLACDKKSRPLVFKRSAKIYTLVIITKEI